MCRSLKRQAGKRVGKRQIWRKRIIALATAYVVALSGLLTSFGAARAAAEGTFDPLGAICHHSPSGQLDPLSRHSNGNICIDCCCVGCLMPLATLPPPPFVIAPSHVTISHCLVPLAFIALSGARTAKSHRSRAPPYAV